MESCEQTAGQSVYQHGQSVWENFQIIYDCLINNKQDSRVVIPEWIFEYREEILNRLLPLETIKTYLIFHDCGKPFCIEYDEQGRKHFPNHAQVSYDTWKQASDNEQVGQLILHDMDIHTLKSEQIEEFAKMPEAVTLILSGLAEINSNAKMFGGFDSVSFKIKYKQINKKGKKVLEWLRK